MSEAWIQYVNDNRSICKYGSRCYQKNPSHLSKYKHPPINKRKLGTPHTGSDSKKHLSDTPPNNKNDSSDAPDTKKNDSLGNLTIEDEIQPQPSPSKRVNDTSESDKASNLTSDPIAPVTLDASEFRTSNESNTPREQTGATPKKDRKSSPRKQTPSKCNKQIELLTPVDNSLEVLEQLFLVKLPPDFLDFWKFLKELDELPQRVLEKVNLQLIGPYDYLLGKLPQVENKQLYYVHWRYYYDPPEFQALIKSIKKSEFHIGYYRDSPDKNPVFVASNDSSKDCYITPIADNIFGAVFNLLQNEKKSSPFTSMHGQKLSDSLKQWADKQNYTLENVNFKKRKPSVVARTFHGAGIVVPYNKKTELGYRSLAEKDATIKKILSSFEAAKSTSERDKALSDLQPVITYANIAMDECDFGTGLELGIDLFCSGLEDLHTVVEATLSTAYSLLNRSPFLEILRAHLKYRRKGPNVSFTKLL